MTYMIINRNTYAIHHFGGGLIESAIFNGDGEFTDGFAEAETFLAGMANAGNFEIVTSHELNERLEARTEAHLQVVRDWRNASTLACTYHDAIEEYLKDGIEGAMDPEDFMTETATLAGAIGFEFTEDREFTMTVTFTAKVARNQQYFDGSDFSVEVESETSEAEGVEVIDWTITSC